MTKEVKIPMVNLFNHFEPDTDKKYANIDDWLPINQKDNIFQMTKTAIQLPVAKYYNLNMSEYETRAFDNFILVSSKRCYNSPEVKMHICQYLNFFEKYFDIDNELLLIYYRMKYMIDFGVRDKQGNVYPYSKDMFIYDIRKHILSESMINKVKAMTDEEYHLELKYKNKVNEALQYNDEHAKFFMMVSVFQNMMIPLIMHFLHVNRYTSNVESFLLEIYRYLFDLVPGVNIYLKLYETVSTTVANDVKKNSQLWSMSAIRGIDPMTSIHSIIDTIIIQVMPKYKYNENIIMYNLAATRKMLGYSVTAIEYEYDFVSLSASKRDGEDNTSQFDKYEATMIKTNEALYLQNETSCRIILEDIIDRYGPFSEKEINFYAEELSKHGKPIITQFQLQLITCLFAKEFGDPITMKNITSRDYIILMIAAKRQLLKQGMIVLPYIISGRLMKYVTRNSINKKEMNKIENSQYYEAVRSKYPSEKNEKHIHSVIAIILSSDFEAIDYDDASINGMPIRPMSDFIIDEFLMFLSII